LTRKRNLVLIGVAAAALFSAQGTAVADPAPQEQELAPAATAGEQFVPLSMSEARRESGRIHGDAGGPQARSAEAAATVGPVDSTGSRFTANTPVRVLDTRFGVGAPAGKVGPDGVIVLDLSGRVPENATSVVINLTGVSPSIATYLTAWPGDADLPEVSSVNLRAGEVRANAATIPLGANRQLNVRNHVGTTHILADLAGYYAPATGSGFTAQSPVRVLDTRTSGGPLGPGGTRTINFSSRVPADATAVTFNLTGVGASTLTAIGAYPTGAARPEASVLNLAPNQATPNLVTVALGTNRSVTLYNSAGNTQLVADLSGYYTSSGGNSYYQVTPVRLIDTRYGEPLPPNTWGEVALDTDVPASATAVTFNLTGTEPTALTYLTAYPTGSALPNASNLNLAAGQSAANLVTVALGTNKGVNIYNAQGYTHFLMDVAGYFAPPPAPCAGACVHSWGDNEEGQLGVGTIGGYSTAPGRVDGLSNVASVTSSYLNGYALGNGGTVRAWGSNALQGLGNGTLYGSAPVSIRVGSLTGITQIAAGAYSGYALSSAGEVWSWGYNGDGSLGDGSVATRAAPVRVNLPSGIVRIAAGFTTAYALRADGTVWAWGSNGGSLGNGSYGNGCNTMPVGAGCRAVTPIQVPGLTDVVTISSTRSAAFAVKSDGTVWAWGYNAHGELGIGTVGGRPCDTNPQAPNCTALSPVQIPGLTDVATVASGSSSTTYALKTDGTVLSWGYNGDGQLGNGTTGEGCTDPSEPNCVATSPTPVPGLTGVTALAGGAGYAMALAGGSVWSWGFDSQGQLGHPYDLVPVQVPGLTGVTAIGSGGATSFAVR
jgi:alpha-tubulin suppressor-like RCC1 family protein